MASHPVDWEPLTLLDEDVARAAATWLCDWATYGRTKADKLSPRAELVTEGRNGLSIKQHWRHSSCGDLVWFCHYHLGNRAPWVNRDAAPRGYRTGQNLIMVQRHPCYRSGRITSTLQPGDALLMDPGNPHVAVVIAHDQKARTLTLAQYGGTMGAVGTDGRWSEYPSDWHDNDLGQPVRGLEFDGVTVRAEKKGAGASARKVMGHLPLWAVLQRAQSAGQLEEPAYVPPGMPKP